MEPRDRLHQLVDDLIDPAAEAQLHKRIDALPETEVSEALNRLLLLRRLAPERFRSAERHDSAQEESGPPARSTDDDVERLPDDCIGTPSPPGPERGGGG
jgi:hypothetical protein